MQNNTIKNETTPHQWDKHAIKAELGRRNQTLIGVALAAGLREDACRKGIMGISRPGADAVCDFLDLPITTLFPGMYLNKRRAPRSAKTRAKSRKTGGDA